ncbi:transposase [Evansella sp. AB-rgal1]|uniref:transposase n=1 Tax=Evansella sp. AB-rgal1 TaxID=3242696 RepID=UPI00359CBA66
MPRIARKKSSNGVYHIMLRGINRQTIFEDDEDKAKFLETLAKYKIKSCFELYSYCLMDNHVHLLLKEIEEPLATIIKRISSSYVYWYNRKYRRCGHLFQDRYKSENVESDSYFITALRYIHQNPLKAGLVKSIWDSESTSIREYLHKGHLIDIDRGFYLFFP